MASVGRQVSWMMRFMQLLLIWWHKIDDLPNQEKLSHCCTSLKQLNFACFGNFWFLLVLAASDAVPFAVGTQMTVRIFFFVITCLDSQLNVNFIYYWSSKKGVHVEIILIEDQFYLKLLCKSFHFPFSHSNKRVFPPITMLLSFDSVKWEFLQFPFGERKLTNIDMNVAISFRFLSCIFFSFVAQEFGQLNEVRLRRISLV